MSSDVTASLLVLGVAMAEKSGLSEIAVCLNSFRAAAVSGSSAAILSGVGLRLGGVAIEVVKWQGVWSRGL
ncbi:hypothetical protein RRF57_003751 [Xylaria bambusicola]|uniref:Uncharacterized protein n=1 Tax=Xylaria bambusicola TaxID=326684 RepID=A0AAN7Z346_9PEZI